LTLVCATLAACPRSEPTITALEGARYLPARAIVHTYCGPCHTRGGRHAKRDQGAYRDLALDTYAAIAARPLVVENALTFHGEHADMPPPLGTWQPSPAERQVLIDWLQRGCPNTPDGK
jgi:mono/diheme cytochrome c family protein